jgi:CRP-like cAMP-binding protein
VGILIISETEIYFDMSKLKIEDIRKYEFFKNLPDSVLVELSQEIEELSLDSGEELYRRGDPGDALYVIQTGWIKLVGEDSDGSEVVLNQVGPGNIIGEMAMLDQEPRSAGVVALTPTKLLKLQSELFVEVLKQEPSIGIQVIRDISERLRFANTYLENAIEWSQRIASGDYGFAKEQMEKAQATVVLSQQADDDRANRFLGTFFRMVEDIREREETLQRELDELIIKIDESKREEEVKELSGSEFFKKLKSKGGKIRSKKSNDEKS